MNAHAAGDEESCYGGAERTKEDASKRDIYNEYTFVSGHRSRPMTRNQEYSSREEKIGVFVFESRGRLRSVPIPRVSNDVKQATGFENGNQYTGHRGSAKH